MGEFLQEPGCHRVNLTKATLSCNGCGHHLNPHFLDKGSKLREVSLSKFVDLESDCRFWTPSLSTYCSKPTKKTELRGTVPSGRKNAVEACSNKASPNSIMFARLQCNKTEFSHKLHLLMCTEQESKIKIGISREKTCVLGRNVKRIDPEEIES